MSARLVLAAIALVSGGYGLWDVLPDAIEGGYGELSVLAIPVTLWAIWIGRRTGEPGPGKIPDQPWVFAALACGASIAVASGASCLASAFIAPSVLLLVRIVRPELATTRVLLLLLLAPVSYAVDRDFGLSLRIANATAAEWMTHLVDEGTGGRVADELACGPHLVAVTPECSGARLVTRMIALASAFAVLRPGSVRRYLFLAGAAVVLAATANTGRIAAFCVIATHYGARELAALERVHDVSGVIAFALAYVILGVLAAFGRGSHTRNEPV